MATREQQGEGRGVGQAGVADTARQCARRYGLRYLETLPESRDTAYCEQIPIHFLKQFCMVPILTASGAMIAVADPGQFQAVDDLVRLLGLEQAETVVAPTKSILAAINAAYDQGDSGRVAEQVVQRIADAGPGGVEELAETADLLDDTSEAPVIQLVNAMLAQAVRDGASDIHVEPFPATLRIRQRIDGVLYNMLELPAHSHAALSSRLKIMARLNIAEKRLPQDGRISIRIGDKEVDIRVSTLPTTHGERVVLRLLLKSEAMQELDGLGMEDDIYQRFCEQISAPHGILLVTGPTGSGKTTTLYGALGRLNRSDVNIITIEDPVEYQIEGIAQVQVNSKINLTFARGLRTIVRQDPDIILVGEIRDEETAGIAIQSALTGHLVFSTLHTNNSASALTRLGNMGIDPFLLTSSVNAILAQRLVRVLCRKCRQPRRYEELPAGFPAIHGQLYAPKGCADCHQTGFRGRTGIFELLEMTDPVCQLVQGAVDAVVLERQAVQLGMRTLARSGMEKVAKGVTSLEEVLRVTSLAA